MDLFVAGARTFARQRHEQDGSSGDRAVAHAERVVDRLVEAGVTKPEVLAAAALHDVVDDTPTTLDEVTARFGPRVAGLVGELSRGPRVGRRDVIGRVRTGSARAALISVADRLDDLESLAGPERGFRPYDARDALALAASALRNPRLERLFPAERAAFQVLVAHLIDTAAMAIAPRRDRSRRTHVVHA